MRIHAWGARPSMACTYLAEAEAVEGEADEGVVGQEVDALRAPVVRAEEPGEQRERQRRLCRHEPRASQPDAHVHTCTGCMLEHAMHMPGPPRAARESAGCTCAYMHGVHVRACHALSCIMSRHDDEMWKFSSTDESLYLRAYVHSARAIHMRRCTCHTHEAMHVPYT